MGLQLCQFCDFTVVLAILLGAFVRRLRTAGSALCPHRETVTVFLELEAKLSLHSAAKATAYLSPSLLHSVWGCAAWLWHGLAAGIVKDGCSRPPALVRSLRLPRCFFSCCVFDISIKGGTIILLCTHAAFDSQYYQDSYYLINSFFLSPVGLFGLSFGLNILVCLFSLLSCRVIFFS